MRLILALALLVSLTASAGAQPTSPHESAATAAYDRGDLVTALREFEAAYAETQRPDLLYVIGKLLAATGDCRRAIDHFDRFLATGPGPKATEGARTEITACEQKLATQPATDPAGGSGAASGSASDPIAPSTGSSATAPIDRPSRDRLAMVLVGGGVAIDLLALLVYHQARDAQCDAVCTNITYDEYQAKESRASKLRLTSVALASAGTVMLGVGLYRHLTHRRRTVDVALLPTTAGATLVLDGRF